MSTETTTLVGRCYTKARRHPGMVGRWPGGGQIPGGPYTLQQACVAGGVFGLLFLTREVWGVFGIGNYATLLAAPLVAGVLVRRMHIDGRSPVAVAMSLAGLALRSVGTDARPASVMSGAGTGWVCSVNEASAAGVEASPVPVAAEESRVGAAANAMSAPSSRTAVAGAAAPVRVRSGAAALLARAGGRS